VLLGSQPSSRVLSLLHSNVKKTTGRDYGQDTLSAYYLIQRFPVAPRPAMFEIKLLL
jgi:hypothetical protein